MLLLTLSIVNNSINYALSAAPFNTLIVIFTHGRAR